MPAAGRDWGHIGLPAQEPAFFRQGSRIRSEDLQRLAFQEKAGHPMPSAGSAWTQLIDGVPLGPFQEQAGFSSSPAGERYAAVR